MLKGNNQSTLPIRDVKIGDRLRTDVGDIDELALSIKKHGLLHPIVLNEHNELVAGLRRLRACQKLSWNSIPVHIVNISDLLQCQIHENSLRKDFTVSEIGRIAEIVHESRIGHRPKKGANLVPFGEGKTVALVANYCGLSPYTVQKAYDIYRAGKKHKEYKRLLQNVDNGTTSIEYAHKTFLKIERAEHRPAEIINLPQGVYTVLYADPPWKYDIPLRADPDQHYPTIETQRLIEMKVPAADDAVLFLWSTNPVLPDALRVMEGWGFTYVSNICWKKPKWAIGHWLRGQHELLLLGKKGDIETPLPHLRPTSVVEAPTGKHSEKPQIFYKIIEDMFPHERYLELFARPSEQREKWVYWGDEVTTVASEPS